MKIVEITWVDSTTHGGWKSQRDYVHNGLTVGEDYFSTVGYLVYRDKDVIQVVQSVAPGHEQLSDSITIPIGCVKRVRVIRK